jgi:hypothetical protein
MPLQEVGFQKNRPQEIVRFRLKAPDHTVGMNCSCQQERAWEPLIMNGPPRDAFVRSGLRASQAAPLQVYFTTSRAASRLESKTSECGHAGQKEPRLALLGSPSRAKLPTLWIIFADRSSRPAWFARLNEMFE